MQNKTVHLKRASDTNMHARNGEITFTMLSERCLRDPPHSLGLPRTHSAVYLAPPICREIPPTAARRLRHVTRVRRTAADIQEDPHWLRPDVNHARRTLCPAFACINIIYKDVPESA